MTAVPVVTTGAATVSLVVGQLPVTGIALTAWAGVAAVLLVTGLVLRLVGRERD